MLMNQKQKGFTFSELMVALVLNTLLLSALLTVFLANLDHYHKAVNSNRFNQQMQAAMDLMVGDIRRAGYWANASSDIALARNTNPFVAAGADITINGSGNCILFSYDHDSNSSLASISSSVDDEHYGFRLSGQALQARPPGAAFDCTAASSAWENVTDTKIVNITNLSFTLNTSTITTGPGTQGIQIRSVDISMTGQVANDATVTKTLTQHVRIRNDKFIP